MKAGTRDALPTKTTIYDVAKKVGVSPSTVSRALSNPGRVSQRTLKLVEDAAAALEYRANPHAQALQTGRTGMVGLIVADITNPSYFDIVRGAQQEASLRGYRLVIADSAESGHTEADIVERLQSSTDGLILASPRMSDHDIQKLKDTTAITLINRSVAGIGSIVPDVDPGVSEAIRHLVFHGHQKIAFLAGPDQSWISARRWDSVAAACQWTGRESVLVPTLSPTYEGGRRVAREVLESGATAAVCFNDLLAIGLLQELQAASVKVPDEFSVIGFDNIFGSWFTTPALTTIAAPYAECGSTALIALTAQLEGEGPSPRGKAADPPALGTSLLVRGSSGRLLSAR